MDHGGRELWYKQRVSSELGSMPTVDYMKEIQRSATFSAMSWRQSPMRDDIEYPLIKSDQRDVFRSILLIKPTVRVGERQMSRLVTRPGPIQPLDVMDTDCSRTYNIFQSCNGNADPYSLHLIQPWPLSPSTRIFVDSICSSTWETCSTLTVTPKEVTSVVSLTKLTI